MDISFSDDDEVHQQLDKKNEEPNLPDKKNEELKNLRSTAYSVSFCSDLK